MVTVKVSKNAYTGFEILVYFPAPPYFLGFFFVWEIISGISNGKPEQKCYSQILVAADQNRALYSMMVNAISSSAYR